MVRRFLAIAVIMVLAVSTVGHIDAFAATDQSEPAELALGGEGVVGTDVSTDGLLITASSQTDCIGCMRCLNAACSLDSLHAAGTIEPPPDHREAGWRIAFERLHKTTLDPGLRPPIPVS